MKKMHFQTNRALFKAWARVTWHLLLSLVHHFPQRSEGCTLRTAADVKINAGLDGMSAPSLLACIDQTASSSQQQMVTTSVVGYSGFHLPIGVPHGGLACLQSVHMDET